jgi:hypothetical protein
VDDRATDWFEALADDPDFRALSPVERERLVAVLERMLEMGIGAVYADEAPDVPDAEWDCGAYLHNCRARCCTLTFALTKEEAQRGTFCHDPAHPFFIAHEADGYCPHLDRATLQCQVWEQRPLRCRRYDCQGDTNIWPDGIPIRHEPDGL